MSCESSQQVISHPLGALIGGGLGTNGQALTGSDIVHAFNDNIRLLGPVTKLYTIDWSYWLVQVHVSHQQRDNDKLLTSGPDTYRVDMTRLSHEQLLVTECSKPYRRALDVFYRRGEYVSLMPYYNFRIRSTVSISFHN